MIALSWNLVSPLDSLSKTFPFYVSFFPFQITIYLWEAVCHGCQKIFILALLVPMLGSVIRACTMQSLLANRALCFLFNELQSVSLLEASMVLMKGNRPLQLALSRPPCPHSFPPPVYSFHSNQTDFFKMFVKLCYSLSQKLPVDPHHT